jgi:hypothetical protein
MLGCRWVTGQHYPISAAGHALTEFAISGPGGTPPSMHIRTVYTYAEDGRWAFDTIGNQLPFEHPEAYSARLKRERLTRDLLVEYLAEFGINPDDSSRFGRSAVVRQVVDWNTNRRFLAAERRHLGIAPVSDGAIHALAEGLNRH